jgi:sulfur carrier protein
MKVVLHHPRREVDVDGPMNVAQLLDSLQLIPEAFLVIRGRDLLTRDIGLRDDDVVELRPVISGG